MYKTPPVCRMGVHRNALPLQFSRQCPSARLSPPPETSWLPGPVAPFPTFSLTWLTPCLHTALFFLSLLCFLFHHLLWILSFAFGRLNSILVKSPQSRGLCSVQLCCLFAAVTQVTCQTLLSQRVSSYVKWGFTEDPIEALSSLRSR